MRPAGSRAARPRRLLMLVLLGAPALAGCTEVESAAVDGYQPAKLEHIPGSDDERVIFTAEGARRTGLETGRVTRDGGRLVVPYEALIYEPEGATFVYTQPRPLTFTRTAVEIERIDGDRVVLADGPKAGTEVVTIGAAEIYGTETGIAGGH